MPAKKPFSYADLRALLSRMFAHAKQEAQTLEQYRAIDKEECRTSRKLLEEMIQGDDDGEWIRRV